jgi:hypothetical protein
MAVSTGRLQQRLQLNPLCVRQIARIHAFQAKTRTVPRIFLRGYLPQFLDRFLDTIRRSSGKLSTLIEDLLSRMLVCVLAQ